MLADLIDSLPSDPASITKEVLLSFFDMVKTGYLFKPKDVKHPKFEVLCEATEQLLPHLDTKMLTNMFVAILPSKAVMHHEMGKLIADALNKRVSFIPFDQITFIDYLLNKFYDGSELSYTYNELRSRMLTQFLKRVEDELDGFSEFERLMNILAYCEGNSQNIPDKIANAVATSLLIADKDKFTVTNITSVMCFLANHGQLNEHLTKLLHKMTDLWIQLPFSAKEVQILFKLLAAKRKTADKDMFKIQSKFIEHCTNAVIQYNNHELSIHVLSSFNKLVRKI